MFYFQYQVVPRTGEALQAVDGAFGLGEHIINTMRYFGKEYNVWCLVPIKDADANVSRAEALAQAYGGPYLNTSELCERSPHAVSIDQNGYVTIAKRYSASLMAEFLTRVVHHLGAIITNETGLNDFAHDHMDMAVSSFDGIVAALSTRPPPSWIAFDVEGARCIADRTADISAVVLQMQRACANGGRMTKNSCKNIPPGCSNDTFAVADYIFSSYYTEKGSDPFDDCYTMFDGIAMFSSRSIWWNLYPACVMYGFGTMFENPPGNVDVHSLLLVHPRRGYRMPTTTPTTSTTIASPSVLSSTTTSTAASPAPQLSSADAVVVAPAPSIVASDTNTLGSHLPVDVDEAASDGVPGWGWIIWLAIAAVLCAIAGGAMWNMPKPEYLQRSKRNAAGRSNPAASPSSEEDGEMSASESDSETAQEATKAPPQHPRQPLLLPLQRRERPSVPHMDYSVARGAGQGTAMAMPTAVRAQMNYVRTSVGPG